MTWLSKKCVSMHPCPLIYFKNFNFFKTLVTRLIFMTCLICLWRNNGHFI